MEDPREVLQLEVEKDYLRNIQEKNVEDKCQKREVSSGVTKISPFKKMPKRDLKCNQNEETRGGCQSPETGMHDEYDGLGQAEDHVHSVPIGLGIS